MAFRYLVCTALVAASFGLAAPALAHDDHVTPALPAPGTMHHGGYDPAAYDRARADWLADCRANHSPRKHGKKAAGAVVGGLVGGVIGNRVAGDGNRTVGTVLGAAAGAVAGGAIGSAADGSAARESLDYCEDYLNRYSGYGQGAYGFAPHGLAYGWQPMMVMVPVAMAGPMAPPAAPRDCEETITTEEFIDPPARRVIPPRPRADKRVRVVPDKRVRIN